MEWLNVILAFDLLSFEFVFKLNSVFLFAENWIKRLERKLERSARQCLHWFSSGV